MQIKIRSNECDTNDLEVDIDTSLHKHELITVLIETLLYLCEEDNEEYDLMMSHFISKHINSTHAKYLVSFYKPENANEKVLRSINLINTLKQKCYDGKLITNDEINKIDNKVDDIRTLIQD